MPDITHRPTIATSVILIYAIATGLYAVLSLTPLAGNRWSEWVNALMPWPLAPAPLLMGLLLAFAARRPLTQMQAVALSLLPACALLAWHYLPLFLPKPGAASGRALSVATFNLYARAHGFEPVFALIRAMDADVVALQEVDDAAVPALDGALADFYPYRRFHPVERWGTIGMALLSKHPIIDDEFWVDGLGQQRVTLDIDGRALVLYNAHPPAPFVRRRFPPIDARRRDGVIEKLLARVNAERDPVIIAGDFNLNDASPIYRALSARLTDAWRAAGSGLGPTWPAAFDMPYPRPEFPQNAIFTPILRIDYVFAGPGVGVSQARVWPGGAGSDHRPLRAVLTLPGY